MDILHKQASHRTLTPDVTWTTIKQELTQVLNQEAIALDTLSKNLPENVELLIQSIVATTGKVIFSGYGKSGLVARKVAATFSSLGIPASFLHPADALHGDLGMVQAHDLFILFSKSGNVTEFEQIFSFLHSQKTETVIICCASGISSTKADLIIQLPFDKEACTLNLAPTSSSTLMMAFGDALAVVISTLKNFDKHHFARLHPAGTLGKKLLFTVKDLMHTDNALPILLPRTEFKDLLFIISSKKMGVGIVVNEQTKLCGIITDGDLRRACNKGPEVFNLTATQIMSPNPKYIRQNVLATDALAYMEEQHITSLIVTEGDIVIGLIHIHDIIKAGLQG